MFVMIAFYIYIFMEERSMLFSLEEWVALGIIIGQYTFLFMLLRTLNRAMDDGEQKNAALSRDAQLDERPPRSNT